MRHVRVTNSQLQSTTRGRPKTFTGPPSPSVSGCLWEDPSRVENALGDRTLPLCDYGGLENSGRLLLRNTGGEGGVGQDFLRTAVRYVSGRVSGGPRKGTFRRSPSDTTGLGRVRLLLYYKPLEVIGEQNFSY